MICPYCGCAEQESRAGATVCRQCGLTPDQAQDADRQHRGMAEQATLRADELRRRSDKVVEASTGMPMRERVQAASGLIVGGQHLTREQWEAAFTTWRRNATARVRAGERRAG